MPRRGVEKEWFQQSATMHSGAGENETLNINVVGNRNSVIYAVNGKIILSKLMCMLFVAALVQVTLNVILVEHVP